MVWFIPVVPAVDPGPDGSGGSLLGILVIVNLFFNAIPCVLTALALWRTARWRGIVRPWLALIPIADLWVLGSLADRHSRKNWGKGNHMGRNLPIAGAAALGSLLLLSVRSHVGVTIGFLGALAAWAVFLVLRFIALCRFYESCAPGDPVLYIALSIVFPPLIPLFIFKCRW